MDLAWPSSPACLAGALPTGVAPEMIAGLNWDGSRVEGPGIVSVRIMSLESRVPRWILPVRVCSRVSPKKEVTLQCGKTSRCLQGKKDNKEHSGGAGNNRNKDRKEG